MAFARGRHELPQKEMSAAEFRAWLRQFEGGRDGGIGREELQRALRSVHAWCAWWKARQAMKAADANRNGVVEAEQMSCLVVYANQHLHLKIYEYDSSS